jgi:hypothetical protein
VGCTGAPTTVRLERLGASGVESLVGRGQAGDQLQGKVTLAARDADTAKSLAESFEQNLAKIKQDGAQQAQNQKELAPVLETLDTVKIASKDRTITLEGQTGAEAIHALFTGWFMMRAAPVPREKEPDK